MSNQPSRRDDREVVASDQRSCKDLLRGLQQLRAESAYLKKSAGLDPNQVALGARERTVIVFDLTPHFPLADLLRAAELVRSSFYNQLRALRTGNKHCDLKVKSREILHCHKGRCGDRLVAVELRRQGLIVNHETL